MAISPQLLTIYLYSAHREVIFAIAQLPCLTLNELNTKNSVTASKNWTLNVTAAARKKFDSGLTGQSTTSTLWKFDSVSRRNSTALGSSVVE